MYGGNIMSDLQMTMQKVYMLSDGEQSAIAKLIDAYIESIKPIKKHKSKIIVGKYDGKFNIIDDIDFCNDEIAQMFGVND